MGRKSECAIQIRYFNHMYSMKRQRNRCVDSPFVNSACHIGPSCYSAICDSCSLTVFHCMGPASSQIPGMPRIFPTLKGRPLPLPLRWPPSSSLPSVLRVNLPKSSLYGRDSSTALLVRIPMSLDDVWPMSIP